MNKRQISSLSYRVYRLLLSTNSYQFLKGSQPRPEYVAVPTDKNLDIYGAVAAWNMMWEAGIIRYEMLDDHRWFKGLKWLKSFEHRGVDLRLIPLNGACRYNISEPVNEMRHARLKD
jgi:hypothetical protein